MTAKKDIAEVRKKKSILWEYGESFVIAVLLAFFIKAFIVQAFKIPSGSMIPTLLVGDHILVSKFIYGIKVPFTDITLLPIGKPERGDIIVFKYPVDESKDFIKRVVGMPGDVVEVRDKQVFVNGILLDWDFTIHEDPNILPRYKSPRDNMSSRVVPEESYFVMGDNRDNSMDSRMWGFVNFKKIKGKAFMIYFSWNRRVDSYLPWKHIRYDRIGDILK